MAVMLVDLETVKQHLRMDSDYADDLIVRKTEQAGAILANWLKTDISIWDIDSTESVPLPLEIEAAVLLAVEALFDGSDPLSDTVRALLHRHRDPALA
jgi:hypothetical protein